MIDINKREEAHQFKAISHQPYTFWVEEKSKGIKVKIEMPCKKFQSIINLYPLHLSFFAPFGACRAMPQYINGYINTKLGKILLVYTSRLVI